MMSPGQDAPALRASATSRELERIRAKRRLLEAAAKAPLTAAANTETELQQQALPVPNPSPSPAHRNARIKSNARKLLDQLQTADTSLADASHNLKLLFAKQALRALADRQAAAAAEAQQRKLDKLKERLEEDHRRQHQQEQHHAIQAQLQVQQQAQQQAQLQAQLQAQQQATVQAQQLSLKQQEHAREQRRHRSRSAGDRHRRSPSRRPSPSQLRSSEEYESMGGYSYDSDVHRSDASHVRDTRHGSSRSRHQQQEHHRHPRDPHPRDHHEHAGPTEAGVRGAVSAQALSALLAGLQSHGVNLTSGPPPPLPPAPPPPPGAAAAVQTDPVESGETRSGSAGRHSSSGVAPGASGARGAAGEGTTRGGGGNSRAAAADAADDQQQYVLLPDGTVGLVHTIVKPAVLQPQMGTLQMPTTPPHAVPLVLMQPGGHGSGGGVTVPPGAHWPAMQHGMPYPYGPLLGHPQSPYYAHSPSFDTQHQYSYTQSPYGYPAPPSSTLSPHGYPFSPTQTTASGMPPPYMPPYHQQQPPPYGSDPYYYRQHQPPAPPPPSPYHDKQGHHFSQYRPDHPAQPHQHGAPNQPVPPPPAPSSEPDGRNNIVRNSISSLSSDPYGNLVGSGLGAGSGGPDDPGGGGGGGHRGDGRPQPQPPTAAPPSAGSSGVTMPSPGNEPQPGNGPGGSGGYSGGRYHHQHSHSGGESLRSVPSNSGGSLIGVAGSVSMSASQQYEPTLASPSPRDSLQGLDSPASFRDMPRRASGSVSLSPRRGVIGSYDLGPHSSLGTTSRLGPSPLYATSTYHGTGGSGVAPERSNITGPSASSGSSSAGSVILRVTSGLSQPSLQSQLQVPSAFSAASQLGPGGGNAGSFGGGDAGGGVGLPSSDEPSLLLRMLDMGSPMQGSKVSEDLPETPTSRKPSLSSPWSSSTLGPGDIVIGGGGGGYQSGRDLLADVVSRPPLYGTSLPYGTAGLYDRYTAGGFYGATSGLYAATSYGAPSSFGGFGVSPSSVGGVGSGGGASGGLGPRSPSSDSIRSANGGGPGGFYTQQPQYGGEGSAALALTAAILEGSTATTSMSAATVGMSAAAVQGLNQMGLGHLYPLSPAASPSGAAAAASGSSMTAAGSGAAGSGLGRTSSLSPGPASDSGSAAAGAVGSGQSASLVSAANAALLARLSHVSNNDGTYSPRSRSRVQLMGNDDLTEVLSPRSTNASGHNIPSPAGGPSQYQQPASGGTSRLSAATISAQQLQLQQQQQMQQQQLQQPSSPAQYSPTRLASRSPTGEMGVPPSVPTLQLPTRARSGALPSAPAPGGGASGPSSGHPSPTRQDQPGLDQRERDYEAEQSLSARSGRSMFSEGHGGGAMSISSGERVSGVPVMEHRDGGVDAAAYAGVVGSSGVDMLGTAGGGAAYSTGANSGAGGFVAMGGSQQQHPQGMLPSLLDLMNMGHVFSASPSGSAGMSPLGFGGSSTPLERSADSFVRIGSMLHSGAASPMGTGNPNDVLGSPKYPMGSGPLVQGGRGSSGGASSGGGGGGGGPTGTFAAGAVGGGRPPGSSPVPSQQSTPTGVGQQQLTGMSFRMSGPEGGGAQAGAAPSVPSSPLTSPAAPPALSRAASAHSMGLAGASSKVLSPSGSKSARLPVSAAPASPAQRTPVGAAATGAGRTTAILTRVLSGRGEFDSDDDDEVYGVPYTSPLNRGPGVGGSMTRTGSTFGTSPQRSSPGRPRGSLAGGGAHDDEFNF